MENKKDITRIILVFYVVAALLTLGVFVCSYVVEEKDPVPGAFSGVWYSDPGLSQSVDLKHPVLNDGKGSFFAVVPGDIKSGDCLWFKNKNGYLTVTVGEKARVHRAPLEYNLYGWTAGTDWICVPLDLSDANKTIRIDFFTNYGDNSAYIDEIYIGKAVDDIRFTLSDRLFGAVLCILMMFFGLVLIAAHLICSFRVKQMPYELLYLGLFSFFFSAWSLTELRVMQLFTEKNAGVFHNLTCMSMMLLATPLLLYFKQDMDRVNRYIALSLIGLSCVDFVVCCVLHFGGILDFHQTLTLTHITIAIGAGGVLYANFLRIFRKDEQTRGDIPVAVCMILVIISGCLDIFRYRLGGVKDASFFTRIGLFLYIMVLGIRSLWYVMNLAEKGMKMEIISRLAYEDGLTGLGNRTAYNERLEELSGKAATIFVFDINNLKYVNDTFGHAAGDELIKTGAELIDSVFGDFGKCYRVGGDEFVCLALGQKDCNKCEEEFYHRIQVINRLELLQFPLAIAMGYESCEQGGDLSAAAESADRKMYLKKKELKQDEHGKYDRDRFSG